MPTRDDIIEFLNRQVREGEIAKKALEFIEQGGQFPAPSPLPSGQLSPNFSLSEMTYSATAISQGIPNNPNADQVAKLTELCNGTLEKIRTLARDNPMPVSSGFRSPQLNAAIGGASNSAHMYGCAADFTIPGYGDVYSVCQLIEKNLASLPIDQLIYERPGGVWVHVGIAIPPSTTPRRQVLTITASGTFNGLVK